MWNQESNRDLQILRLYYDPEWEFKNLSSDAGLPIYA